MCQLCRNWIWLYIMFLRMVPGLTAEMGSSGALSEDINNPCRETELKKMYEQFKNNLLPNFIERIHKGSKKNIKDKKQELIALLKVIFFCLCMFSHHSQQHLFNELRIICWNILNRNWTIMCYFIGSFQQSWTWHERKKKRFYIFFKNQS